MMIEPVENRWGNCASLGFLEALLHQIEGIQYILVLNVKASTCFLSFATSISATVASALCTAITKCSSSIVSLLAARWAPTSIMGTASILTSTGL